MFVDKLLAKFMLFCCRYDSAFTDLTKHILNEVFIQPMNTNFDMDAYALDTTIKKKILVSCLKLFYVLPSNWKDFEMKKAVSLICTSFF